MKPRRMKETHEGYTRVTRGRHARHTGNPARAKLLDEYCQTTGLERNDISNFCARFVVKGLLRGGDFWQFFTRPTCCRLA